jgi:hypothetical protein
MHLQMRLLASLVVLCGVAYAESVNEIRSLTVDQAQQMVDRAARGELPSEQDCPFRYGAPQALLLDSVKEMSPEVARVLATHNGHLSLGGIRQLSVDVAEALTKGRPNTDMTSLTLDGLFDLSPEIATALAQCRGPLSLSGLQSLSLETANALASSPRKPYNTSFFNGALGNWLTLNGLDEVEPSVIACLRSAGWEVSLDGLKDLSPEVAAELAKQSGVISLNGVTNLSPAAAKALTSNDKGLALKGLKALSPEVAENLATGSASLDLSGLTDMNLEVARAFRKHRGPLILDGLRELSPSVAHELAKRAGPLSLAGIQAFGSPALAAKVFSGKGIVPSWMLFQGGLPLLRSISAEEIEAIKSARRLPPTAQYHFDSGSDLSLRCMSLSVEAAEAVARHRGNVSVELHELPPDVAKALAEFNWHEGHGRGRALFSLELASELSPAAAEELSRFKGQLRLTVPTLTPVAEAIRRSDSGCAIEVAEAKKKPPTPEIVNLPPQMAAKYARNQGDICLDHVKSLSLESAIELAKHTGYALYLNGLNALDPDVEKALAAYAGYSLSLESLRHLATSELSAKLCECNGSGPGGTWGFALQTVSLEAAHEIARWDCSLLPITSVSPDIAAALAGCVGSLGLSVRTLDVDTARMLTDREGDLTLDALQSLAPDTAAALAHCKGNLSLCGLLALDTEAAKALRPHTGRLIIQCPEKMSAETQAALAQHVGPLEISETFFSEPFELTDWNLRRKLTETSGSSDEYAVSFNAMTLSAFDASELSGKGKDIVLSRLRELPPDVAKKLARATKSIQLNAMPTLEVATADALAPHEGPLELDGVREVSQDVAESLAFHRGGLSMDGLERLTNWALATKLAQSASDLNSVCHCTPEAIEAWAKTAAHGKYGLQAITLNALHELDGETAAALVRGAGGAAITLGRIPELAADAGIRLGEHRGALNLPALVDLDRAVAENLSHGEGALEVGIFTLNADVAGILAKRRGGLSFPRLGILSADVANALAGHEGDLSFDGLSTISDAAAAALAPHNRRLWLKGVVSMPRVAADALAQHQGDVFFHWESIRQIPGNALPVKLVKQWQPVVASPRDRRYFPYSDWTFFPLRLTRLDSPVLTSLMLEVRSDKFHPANLNHLEELTLEAQDALAGEKNRFELRGLRALRSPALAERLAKDSAGVFGGWNVGSAVRELSPEAAAALAANAKTLSLRLDEVSADVAKAVASQKGQLSIDTARLDSVAVEILASHKGPLSVGWIVNLSPKEAEALTGHHGELRLSIRPGGLTPAVARILAAREGSLAIEMKEITPDIAAELARCKGALSLNAIVDMPVEVAACFVDHRARLCLDGVRSLTEDAAAALARHTGPLSMRGLVALENEHLAARLSEDGESSLDFPDLRYITPDAARALVNSNASFALNAIRRLDVQTARSFEDHNGSLSLNGIQVISAEVEETLARHKGPLELSHIVRLTNGGLAAKLVNTDARSEGRLDLSSLQHLTPEAAQGLAKHVGHLSLGGFNGLSNLSPEVAGALAVHKGELMLRNVETISTAAAAALAKHEGPVDLEGLKDVSPEALTSLRANPAIKLSDRLSK